MVSRIAYVPGVLGAFPKKRVRTGFVRVLPDHGLRRSGRLGDLHPPIRRRSEHLGIGRRDPGHYQCQHHPVRRGHSHHYQRSRAHPLTGYLSGVEEAAGFFDSLLAGFDSALDGVPESDFA